MEVSLLVRLSLACSSKLSRWKVLNKFIEVPVSRQDLVLKPGPNNTVFIASTAPHEFRIQPSVSSWAHDRLMASITPIMHGCGVFIKLLDKH